VNEEEVLCLLLASKGEEDKGVWYLDTGASSHMSSNKEFFTNLDESIAGNIVFGDNTKVLIKGKGDILIRTKNSIHHLISQVYYVPSLKSNILSLGQRLEISYDIHMKNRSLTLKDMFQNLITKEYMARNRMFFLKVQVDHPKCLKTCVKDDSWIWHLRLAHLNFGGLKSLAQEKMVNGLPFMSHPNQLCEGCLIGKQTRKSFPKEVNFQASEPLQLVHA